MPTIPEITVSIENQQSLIIDAHAKNGTFKRDSRGRLVKYAGGFAVTYPYNNNGEDWAFRCWQSIPDGDKHKFDIIASTIQRVKLPFLCNFIYTDKGIIVGDKTYPTIRMRWINGLTIKDYICKNCNNKNVLISLANNFMNLVKSMHKNSLAHGDLQHGNIMIDNSGDLYLIDYDSFYCQDLQGEKDIIKGLKNYQHPARYHNSIASEKLDYFSELIIYISILGVAYNPQLCSKYKIEDSEGMLFNAKDFENITASSIYHDLTNLAPIFSCLLKILDIYLSKNDIQTLEPFDVIIERLTSAPEIVNFDYTPKSGLYIGDSISFAWMVKNYTNIYIDGQEIKTTTYTQTLSSAGTKIFTIKAANEFKSVSESISINILELPVIELRSSVKALRANKGEQCTISWNVEHISTIYIEYDNNSYTIDPIGELQISPTTTTKYTIKAIGEDGVRTFTKDITIGVFDEAKIEFSADRLYTLPGVPVTLTWHVENAKAVELQQYGAVPPLGTKCVNIKTDTTFTLIVTDEFGTQNIELDIKMMPLPSVKCINVPMPNLNQKVTICANITRPIFDIVLPSINIHGIEFKIPTSNIQNSIGNTQEIHLPNIHNKLISGRTSVKVPIIQQHTSILTKLKSLFTYYYNKIKL